MQYSNTAKVKKQKVR